MLNIGERIIQLRKAKNWSQDELAKHVNASRIMIGKYERGDNAPSVEVLLKLAKAFGVSLDYLVGEGVNAAFDKEMINRLENVENLPQEEKERIFHFIDLIIRDHKAGQAYANK
ncbi:Putative PBSX repressor [Salinivirga cyanobacteriivorans]|uniref:PBSX repressor n=1 Tax=Salinivirga cyanobacteriivorans TaxID=1307839 RepID=A0A0S2HV22_9BACT|nr:helix-turn-helix transcriptional regulator [Salinivirga cyanobacteriivorans]ALO13866.1 Putative PBSX repressor [Salinivirga cyanobacteriivorans]ALO13872.1 Putative PBSX repressor [Salinivirga cyanobacteriivorans]